VKNKNIRSGDYRDIRDINIRITKINNDKYKYYKDKI